VDRARDPGIGTGRPAAGADGRVLWQDSRAEGGTAPWGSAGVVNPVARINGRWWRDPGLRGERVMVICT